MNFHAMDVIGVRVEMPSNQPIVLLKEIGGERYLPIWIGAVVATAIAFAQHFNDAGAGFPNVHAAKQRQGVGGALPGFSPMMQQTIAFAEKGGKVFGVCNGFQILCESGLLPGVL